MLFLYRVTPSQWLRKIGLHYRELDHSSFATISERSRQPASLYIQTYLYYPDGREKACHTMAFAVPDFTSLSFSATTCLLERLTGGVSSLALARGRHCFRFFVMRVA